MNAPRKIQVVATSSIFERAAYLARTEIDAEQRVRKVANARNEAGDQRLQALDVDGFLAEQLATMELCGHWARLMNFNATGNHSAILEYIPTAGEQPKPVFGNRDFSNPVAMRLSGTHDGHVRFEVYSHNQNHRSVHAVAGAVTRDTLELWFTEFVRIAVRFAADQKAARR